MTAFDPGRCSVHDIAAALIDGGRRPMSSMKLHKMVYFAQGWALALSGVAVFREFITTSQTGPVVRALFPHHKGAYTLTDWPAGDPSLLGPIAGIIVESIGRQYGACSGPQLSEISQAPGGAWSRTRDQHGGEVGHTITHDTMQSAFARLLNVREAS